MGDTSSYVHKVSVLMSVYNGERYLHEAIESILAQTFSDFEFIIIDDSSHDGTWQILTGYAARDGRIRVIRHDRNIGLTKSLNEGLAVAKGEYIARMDADDVSLPDRFEIQTAFLDAHTEVGVAGTAFQLIDDAGTGGQIVQFPEEHGLIRWFLCFFFNPIAHPTIMIRQKLVTRAGIYDESLTTSQDYDLWCRTSSMTRLCNLPQVLLFLRKHAESISNTRPLEQERNALAIGSRLIRQILHGKIGSDDLISSWKVTFYPESATADDISRAAKVARKLVFSIFRNGELSLTERRKIKEDAERRLRVLMEHDACNIISYLRLFLDICLFRKLCT